MQPNLFSYATSELSQDAFFCWLLEWAKTENKIYSAELNSISMKFINYILGINSIPEVEIIDNLRIVKQENNIDFYIVINNCIFLLFEDKINTKMHGDQLQRYKSDILKRYNYSSNCFVYLKSDLVWNDEMIILKELKYTVIDIYKLIEILPNNCEIPIYSDYMKCLTNKATMYMDYLSKPINKWDENEKYWKSYYYNLENRIENSKFGEYHVGNNKWLILIWETIQNHNNVYISLEIKRSKALIILHLNADENKEELINKYIDIIRKNLCEYMISIKNTGRKNVLLAEINEIIKTNEENMFDLAASIQSIKALQDAFRNILIKIKV